MSSQDAKHDHVHEHEHKSHDHHHEHKSDCCDGKPKTCCNSTTESTHDHSHKAHDHGHEHAAGSSCCDEDEDETLSAAEKARKARLAKMDEEDRLERERDIARLEAQLHADESATAAQA